MAYERLNGIVIKETVTEEADKVITLLTDKKGKITVYAKGAKRTRSSIALSTQLLCYSSFVLYKGKEMYTLNSAEIIESFYNIREDMEKIIYAAHIMEIVHDGVNENQSEYKVMRLVLNTLFIIMKPNGRNIDLITRTFELKFLCYIGFYLDTEKCTTCSNDVYQEGEICNICCKGDGITVKMLNGTRNALIYITKSEIKDLFNFNVSEHVLIELKNIIGRYLEHTMEKQYKKLEFLDIIKFV